MTERPSSDPAGDAEERRTRVGGAPSRPPRVPSASPHAVPDRAGPGTAQALSTGPTPDRSAAPRRSAPRGRAPAARARLRLTRVDPWSVMKTAFLPSARTRPSRRRRRSRAGTPSSSPTTGRSGSAAAAPGAGDARRAAAFLAAARESGLALARCSSAALPSLAEMRSPRGARTVAVSSVAGAVAGACAGGGSLDGTLRHQSSLSPVASGSHRLGAGRLGPRSISEADPSIVAIRVDGASIPRPPRRPPPRRVASTERATTATASPPWASRTSRPWWSGRSAGSPR